MRRSAGSHQRRAQAAGDPTTPRTRAPPSAAVSVMRHAAGSTNTAVRPARIKAAVTAKNVPLTGQEHEDGVARRESLLREQRRHPARALGERSERR